MGYKSMSKQNNGRNPIEDITLTRGYLINTRIETHNLGVDYTFLAANGGTTERTEDAAWFDTLDAALDAIYKHGIKPTRQGGVVCPRVVRAREKLVIEQVAFECSFADGEEV